MPARVYKETIEETGIYQCNPGKSEVLTWDGSGRQFALHMAGCLGIWQKKSDRLRKALNIRYRRGTESAESSLIFDGWSFGVLLRRWC